MSDFEHPPFSLLLLANYVRYRQKSRRAASHSGGDWQYTLRWLPEGNSITHTGWLEYHDQTSASHHAPGWVTAIYLGKHTIVPNMQYPVYPNLLLGKNIWLLKQVWATNITFVKLKCSYVFIVVILDLYSRRVLSWILSNTIYTDFCVAISEKAIAVWGVLRISTSITLAFCSLAQTAKGKRVNSPQWPSLKY